MPFSFQFWLPATNNIIPIADKIVPAKGIFRLCKKLPKIISLEAHKLPRTVAFNQTGLRIFSLFKH
jgi:hypothetical protein